MKTIKLFPNLVCWRGVESRLWGVLNQKTTYTQMILVNHKLFKIWENGRQPFTWLADWLTECSLTPNWTVFQFYPVTDLDIEARQKKLLYKYFYNRMIWTNYKDLINLLTIVSIEASAHSEDSGDPVHSHSLNRVFPVRINLGETYDERLEMSPEWFHCHLTSRYDKLEMHWEPT